MSLKSTTKKKTGKKKSSPKRKRVAENMTNEYLDRQAQKLRDVAMFVDYNTNEKYGVKLNNREMKTLELKK